MTNTAEIDAPRESIRELAARTQREAREADALGLCYITTDGWCATHSTGDGVEAVRMDHASATR